MWSLFTVTFSYFFWPFFFFFTRVLWVLFRRCGGWTLILFLILFSITVKQKIFRDFMFCAFIMSIWTIRITRAIIRIFSSRNVFVCFCFCWKFKYIWALLCSFGSSYILFFSNNSRINNIEIRKGIFISNTRTERY